MSIPTAMPALSIRLLEQFNRYVVEQLGLYFPENRRSDLERGIRAAVLEFGFDDEASCLQWLMSAPLTRQQEEVLAANLTVGETYFFRERRIFDLLSEQILPELMEQRREGERNLRFWSAGCCTGEEPCSLAISALQSVPDWERWNVTILGTDMNPRFLRQARSGVFSGWSFRDAPAWMKSRFFTQDGDDRFVARDEVRQLVHYGHLNLARDAYPSLLNDTNAMDVIFCRNVLMYFAPDTAAVVMEKLARCLVPGGWLVLGAGEAVHEAPAPLTRLNVSGVHLYRKPTEDGALSAAEFAAHVAVPALAEFVRAETPAPDVRDSAALLRERILELYRRGSYPQAAAQLEQASHSGVLNAADDLALLARCHANQGRLAAALEWCDRALAADKMNPSHHYLKATILHEQGHLEEAAHAHQNAIFLNYDFALAHFALGNIARSRQRRREAARHFENALGVLRAVPHDAILAESEGLTAGRLAEIIRAMVAEEAAP